MSLLIRFGSIKLHFTLYLNIQMNIQNKMLEKEA